MHALLQQPTVDPRRQQKQMAVTRKKILGIRLLEMLDIHMLRNMRLKRTINHKIELKKNDKNADKTVDKKACTTSL